MKKEMDIVALGELLIDFTEAGTGADGMKLFEQNPGGAPANLLTAAVWDPTSETPGFKVSAVRLSKG